MTKSIFFISVLLIGYVYILYPIIMFLLSKLKRRNKFSLIAYDELPEITIVIPLYNESDLIINKLNDFYSINYPQDKIKYIFVSDGSVDDSDNILSELQASHASVSVIYTRERKGKPNALNLAMKIVSTKIVVFSDIRQTVSKDSIINIISELESSNDIGVVCGELVHVDFTGSTSANVGAYWKYEKWIRHSESRFNSTIGTTGALYALYKKDYINIPIDTILDDFEIPMNILLKGKKIKISDNAFIYDVAHEDLEKEKIRKIRTLSGNYQSFVRMKWLFLPSKNPIFLQFISHKFLRLVVPYLMILSLLTNILLMHESIAYFLLLVIQFLFYFIVVLAKYNSSFRGNKISNFCLVFFELNMSVIYSLYLYLTNKTSVTWNKT